MERSGGGVWLSHGDRPFEIDEHAFGPERSRARQAGLECKGFNRLPVPRLTLLGGHGPPQGHGQQLRAGVPAESLVVHERVRRVGHQPCFHASGSPSAPGREGRPGCTSTRRTCESRSSPVFDQHRAPGTAPQKGQSTATASAWAARQRRLMVARSSEAIRRAPQGLGPQVDRRGVGVGPS